MSTERPIALAPSHPAAAVPRLSRRQLLRQAAAYGLALPTVAALLQACGGAAATSTPASTPTPASRPAASTAPAAATSTVSAGGGTATRTVTSGAAAPSTAPSAAPVAAKPPG